MMSLSRRGAAGQERVVGSAREEKVVGAREARAGVCPVVMDAAVMEGDSVVATMVARQVVDTVGSVDVAHTAHGASSHTAGVAARAGLVAGVATLCRPAGKKVRRHGATSWGSLWTGRSRTS